MTGYPPRRRTPARPYAGKRGGPPSVTTVLGSMGTPGLSWASAKETATFAVEQPEEWQALDHDGAIDRLYRHHRGIWDGRAAMGTLIHAVNEAWTWGESVDLEELVNDAAHRGKAPVRSWQGRERLVAADASGYVDGLERFWLDFSPSTIATEEVVRYRQANKAIYIGQRDWTAGLDGLDGATLLDIKSTANREPDKGYYFDSWRLQLAAYRYANEIVHYEGGEETGTVPNYPVERCCILHLRGDSQYELIEVRAAGDEHGTFLRLVTVHEWMTRGCKTPAPKNLTPCLVMAPEKEAVAV